MVPKWIKMVPERRKSELKVAKGINANPNQR